MSHRRLTALLLGLSLLPSMVFGGGPGCGMRDGAMTSKASTVVATAGAAHAAHAHGPAALAIGHHAHHGGTVSQAADTSSPASIPHGPVECMLVSSCATVVMVASTVLLESVAPHAAGRIAVDAALVPDSPAPGLEPPPPRI